MRKIWLLAVALMFASCGGATNKTTWNDIYSMVDSGELQSKIDRVIFEIGPETHPASVTVLQYFDYFMTGDGNKAWQFIKPGSPLSEKIVSGDNLTKSIEEAKKDGEYRSVAIKGISISKKDSNNKRTARVTFTLKILDKLSNKEYDSIGTYYVIEDNGNWLINDIEKLREEQ